MLKCTIQIQRINPEACLPEKKYCDKNTYSDLGWDLFTLEEVEIPPHSVVVIKTGLVIAFPPDFGAIIKDRSSRSLFYHIVGGVYDASFRGEICVNVLNFNNKTLKIEKHHKFAQMIIIPNVYSEFAESEHIDPDLTPRGIGCLGSTDEK